MKFSIIIPALNEEMLLPDLLESLQRQTFHDFEVIIADAGSQDRTREIASRFGAQVIEGGMPATGRNNGAKAANGEFFVFLDADVSVSESFLQDVYAELEERFLDLATCEFKPITHRKVDELLHDFSNLAVKIYQFTDPHAPGFCIIISKRLFWRVGGFDERLKMAEDHDLVKRASQFRPLRVLNKAQVRVSVRRLEKEGRLKLVSKYLSVELYRIFRGEIKEPIFNYQFGQFTRAEQAQLQRQMGVSRKMLRSVQREYLRLLKLSGGNLAHLPAETIDKLKEQFEKLKDEMQNVFKIIYPH